MCCGIKFGRGIKRGFRRTTLKSYVLRGADADYTEDIRLHFGMDILVAVTSPNKPHLSRIIVLISGTIVLWGILSTAAYFGWVQGADHRDFFPWWAASRLALFQGYSLYTPETTREMQIMLYGAPRPPGVDQQAYHYPAQLSIELLPFWFIPDVHIGAAIWEGLSVLMIIGTLYLLRNTWGKAPVWLIIPALLWQYTLLMIFQAQITALPLMALGVGFWLLLHEHSTAAGIILGLGLVKPELALLPTLVVLGIGLTRKNWRFLATFFITQFILLAVSIGLFGWWIPRWIAAVRGYNSYAQSAWAAQTAWNISPVVAVVAILIVIASLALMRWKPITLFAASIPLGVLLLPQTPMWNLTILLPVLFMAWYKRGRWAVASVWIIGWLLILSDSGPGPTGWRVQSLVVPILTLAVVTYTSRQIPLETLAAEIPQSLPDRSLSV